MSAAEAPDRWTRSLITPEGVDLRLQIASAGQRASAFLIDAAIMIGVMIGLTLLCLLATLGNHSKPALSAIGIVWLLGFFLLRNAYFISFELGPRGATPGKRSAGLRVAARNGEVLTANAIFARNAMREIEVFLPLTFILVPRQGVDAVMVATGLLWSSVFALFPLLNRDRLRIGDIVAGTWVVRTPKQRLAADLADATAAAPRFPFTVAQLDVYGIKELQVLEEVLRRRNAVAIAAVADRIRLKIGWTRGASESQYDFLDAYYLALRRRLEQQMLLGRRRRDKNDHG